MKVETILRKSTSSSCRPEATRLYESPRSSARKQASSCWNRIPIWLSYVLRSIACSKHSYSTALHGIEIVPVTNSTGARTDGEEYAAAKVATSQLHTKLAENSTNIFVLRKQEESEKQYCLQAFHLTQKVSKAFTICQYKF